MAQHLAMDSFGRPDHLMRSRNRWRAFRKRPPESYSEPRSSKLRRSDRKR
jgi:hypothetical protein